MKSLALTKTTVAAGLLLVGLLAGMGAGLHQLVAGPRAENAAAGEAVINAEAAHVPSEEGATEPAVLALAEADAAATDSVPADEKRTGFNIVPRNRDAAAEDPSAGGSVESATAETDESVPDTTAFDQGLAPQSAGSDPAWVDLKSRTAPEQRIVAALADPAVEVLFVDIPLKDAMDFLADAHDITIYIDEQALQDEGITSDQPLDATLKEIELRSVLNLILEPLGLTWIIEDEVLKVTTRSVADERLETRVYPLAHLLSGGRDMESLQQALKNSTAMYTGGDEPEMVWVGSSLVATTSQPAHRRMAELLEQLTRAAEMSENRPTAPVR